MSCMVSVTDPALSKGTRISVSISLLTSSLIPAIEQAWRHHRVPFIKRALFHDSEVKQPCVICGLLERIVTPSTAIVSTRWHNPWT